MEGQLTTPWKAPKPNPIAFASSGTLPKKTKPFLERLSLPVHATPETPLKKERSKFIIPTNISPFAFSPKNIIGNAKITQGTTKTQLSSSFKAGHEIDLPESTLDILEPYTTRSSSPIHTFRDTKFEENIFGLMDMEEEEEEEDSQMDEDHQDDPFSLVAEESYRNLSRYEDEMSLDNNIDVSKHHSLPWKSLHPVFFNTDYFEKLEWEDTGQTPWFPQSHPSSSIIFDSELPEKEYVESHFEIIEIIGSGSFSDVFRARSKSNGLCYALKRSKQPFSGFVDRYKRLQEVRNMWLASGPPNCLQIISSWEQHGYLHILMEMCDNGW